MASAEALAAAVLSSFGDRWAHSQAVGLAAEVLATQLSLGPLEHSRLVAAAWVHDIGYAFPGLHPWHPIAGALYLEAHGFQKIAGLVAWHSTAAEEGRVLGLLGDLGRWPHEESFIQDALDLADMTTGPAGEPMTVAQRMNEVRVRRGARSTQYAALVRARPRLERLENQFSASFS